MPQFVYHDDLRDFIRHGKLDAYELTDDELARFLELWRWGVYHRRNEPSAADYDTFDAVERLEQHLYHTYGVTVEYNTRLLLRQELEAFVHLNLVLQGWRSLWYFLRPDRIFALVRSVRNIRRAKRVRPILGEQELECRGYPRRVLDEARLPRIDLLRRRYWRRINSKSPEERLKARRWL